jgi:hypothetical protein
VGTAVTINGCAASIKHIAFIVQEPMSSKSELIIIQHIKAPYLNTHTRTQRDENNLCFVTIVEAKDTNINKIKDKKYW